MRFDQSTQSEDDPIRPKSNATTNERASRAIRIKLTMLFAMLLLVIFLMVEAGKPERWEWMGFDKTGQSKSQIQDDANTIRMGETPNSERPTQPTNQTQATGDSPQESEDVTSSLSSNRSIQIANQANQSIPPSMLKTKEVDYPTAAKTFWNTTFRKMNPAQQTTLLKLVKNVRLGQSIPASDQESARQITRLLSRLRDQYQQDLFDKLSIAPNGTAETTKLANAMYESAEIWETVQPALEASSRGEEFTIGQLKAVEKLQSVLDPLIYAQVEDRTSIGWKGDPAAWKRIWEKTLAGEVPEPQSVTRIELVGQPDYYRGRAIEVEGWVRRARKEKLDESSELGFSHYYIIWMRPHETKLGPYCVYANSLPEGFPEIGEQDLELNEHVRLQGYFFKVRNYIAADGSVLNCPLIISQSMAPVESTQFTAVDRWQPSRSTLMVFFALIPIIATGLVWIAFRNSKTKPYTPGKKMKTKIDRTLEELSHDPDVQSDRERVMELYETESNET